MPEIIKQKAARAAQKLSFCYCCGDAFSDAPGRDNHPDHIPSGKLFDKPDRNFPIKVACHSSCNQRWSNADEVIAQLVAVHYGKLPDPKQLKLRFELIGTEYFGVSGVNIEQLIVRWVRGFHAALYGQYLPGPSTCHFCVSLPFVRLDKSTNGPVADDGVLQNHVDLVESIRTNRIAGRLDRIVSNNDKCVFECVWTKADQGEPVCVFALKLYDWSRLADRRLDRQSCVGLYVPEAGKPDNATEGLRDYAPLTLANPMDAFAED